MGATTSRRAKGAGSTRLSAADRDLICDGLGPVVSNSRSASITVVWTRTARGEVLGHTVFQGLSEGHSHAFSVGRFWHLCHVCSGTGRWVQAFSELVLRPRAMTATVDLCADQLR